MSRKQRTRATWVFGLLFVGILCGVIFTNWVNTQDPVKRNIVYVFCALAGGLCAAFIPGNMKVEADELAGVPAKISAGRGFAVFFVILGVLNITSGKPQPPDRVSASLTRVVLDQTSGEWHDTNYAASDEGAVVQLATWCAQTIEQEAQTGASEQVVQVRYSPGVFETRLQTNKTTRMKEQVVSVPIKINVPLLPDIRTTAKQKVRKPVTVTDIVTLKELRRNGALSISPQGNPLRPYVFFLDGAGNILKKAPESESKESIMPANGSILLHVSRPGYRNEMLLVQLQNALDKSLTLKKRPVVVALRTDGLQPSMANRLKTMLSQQFGFIIADADQLKAMSQALGAKAAFKTQADVEKYEIDLQGAVVDYVLTVSADK